MTGSGRSGRRWLVLAGWIVFIGLTVGLAAYLTRVGLDKADKVSSSVAAVLALVALGAPYLVPPRGSTGADPSVHATGTGSVAIGSSNTAAIRTDVSGSTPTGCATPTGGGVHAPGAGSVAIGGPNAGDVTTRVRATDLSGGKP